MAKYVFTKPPPSPETNVSNKLGIGIWELPIRNQQKRGNNIEIRGKYDEHGMMLATLAGEAHRQCSLFNSFRMLVPPELCSLPRRVPFEAPIELGSEVIM